MNSKIVQAVGFAHRPGRNTIRRDIQRSIGRFFVWLTYRSWIPYRMRERLVEFGLRFASFVVKNRVLAFVAGGAGMGDTFENDIMKLIFNAVAIANIADNAATSPLTALQLALHTADPGEAGTQTTSEIGYTSYARVAVTRNSSGFTVSGSVVTLTAAVNFPAGTGGSGTAAYFSVGTAATGAGKILVSGTVSPNIICGNGVTPQLTTSTQITID